MGETELLYIKTFPRIVKPGKKKIIHTAGQFAQLMKPLHFDNQTKIVIFHSFQAMFELREIEIPLSYKNSWKVRSFN